MRELIIRTFSGLFILFVVILMSVIGGVPFFAALNLLAMISIYEFVGALKRMGINIPLFMSYAFAFLFMILAFVKSEYSMLVFYVLIGSALITSTFGMKYNIKDMMGFVFTMLYVPFLFSYFLKLDSYLHVLVIYGCAWGTDTFAYLTGITLGRRKLIPRISPKKTIEGSIGGTMGAVLVVFLIVTFSNMGNHLNWIFIAFISSIIAQMGDLTASYIKRSAGIKDFGYIIVGHGGILDRFDSVLLVVPFVYYLNILLN